MRPLIPANAPGRFFREPPRPNGIGQQRPPHRANPAHQADRSLDRHPWLGFRCERPGVPSAGCDTRDHRSNEPVASSERHSERWSLGRLGAFSFFSFSLKTKKNQKSPLTPAPPPPASPRHHARSAAPRSGLPRFAEHQPPEGPTAGEPIAPGTNRSTNGTAARAAASRIPLPPPPDSTDTKTTASPPPIAPCSPAGATEQDPLSGVGHRSPPQLASSSRRKTLFRPETRHEPSRTEGRIPWSGEIRCPRFSSQGNRPRHEALPPHVPCRRGRTAAEPISGKQLPTERTARGTTHRGLNTVRHRDGFAAL